MKNYFPSSIKLLSIILISCLGIIIYSNTYHGSFHFDDNVFIINNVVIRNIQDLHNIWAYFPCRFVTFLSFAVNYHCHQLHVAGYHLFNIAVHLVSAILVWWLTLLTLSTPAFEENSAKSKQLGLLKASPVGEAGHKIPQSGNFMALFAGLIFVSHPVQTESVTFIWQRAASMATMFYLASLCFYIQSRLMRDSIFYYIGALITMMMAMFTKEISITLPLMILIYEVMFLKDKRSLNWRRLSPFLLCLFIIPLITLLTHSARVPHIQGSPQLPEGTSPVQYMLTQLRVMVTYIRLVFIPLNQNFDYDYPISKSILEAPTLFSFLFLIVILYSARRLYPRHRLISFSIFWFFLNLLPESAPFPVKDVIFEHRVYLSLVGYSLFLAGSMYYLLGQKHFKTMVVILLMTVTCYAILTYQRNKVWQDDISLWDDVSQKSPHKVRSYCNLGLDYAKQGNLFQAIGNFNKALEIDPKSTLAYYNRGLCYDKQGKLIQAISDFTKVIVLKPDYAPAYYNRGFCYDKQGDYARAVFDYSKAIEIDSTYADAYNNRGALYGEQGQLTYAISDFTKAIEITPNNASIFLNRSILYYRLKEYDRAWEDVYKIKELGAVVDSQFMRALEAASGRDH